MDTVGLVVPSLLDEGLQFADLPLVVVEEGLGVGDLEDDFGLGEGVGEVETGVATVVEGLAEEGVKLSLEEPIIDVLSESVLGLVVGHPQK